MNATIAIAGLGWLGLPFAQRLIMAGYLVKGSVTTVEKATSLQKKGFDAYPVEIAEAGITGEINAFLKDISVLVVMIPPGLRRNTGADFVLKMTHFLEAIQQSEVKKVILVSSTSVYADSQGEVTEKEFPFPDTEAGKQLFQVEQLFFNSPYLTTTIVRFGGLFGNNRQPVRYLAGREGLNGGNAPVNLIHREDCMGILMAIIKQDAFGHVFNAVTPQHPTKEAYYTLQAKKLELIPPAFAPEDGREVYKQVDSKNIEPILHYRFKKLLV